MRNSNIASSLAIVTVLSLLASPVLAQDNTATPAQPPATAGKMTPSHKMHKDWSSPDRVETRIQTLHDKLGITSDQEDSWKAVADTMRDNEQSIHALIKERHENKTDMTAVDDLKSYEAIAKEHVDGLDKLIPAFETLYGSMSDAQKANADKVFGQFEGHEHHKVSQSK